MERRLAILFSAGMGLGVLLSFPLWGTDRLFPTAPLFDFLPDMPARLAQGIRILYVLLIASVAFVPKPRILLFVFAGFTLLLAAWDQSRMQAWVYFYLCYALLLATRPDLLRYLLIGMYLWAGIQKLNHRFITYAFPWVLGVEGSALVGTLAVVAALFEAACGVLLLIPKWRRAGVWCVVGLHGFLLVVLGPFGHGWNSVVWPWNFVLVAMVFLLFSDARPVPRPRDALSWSAAVLFGVIPFLGTIHVLDPPVTFKLYSGAVSRAYIQPLDPDSLPRELAPYRTPDGDLSIAKWAMGEMNVFYYPADRVYRSIHRRSGLRGHLIIVPDPAVFFGYR